MNSFDSLFPDELYHSYIVEGDPEATIVSLRQFLEKRENYNLDIFIQNYESLTINNVVTIKEWHSQKSVTDGKRICIIAAKFINAEAEQAFLKIIEEPQKGTHFFIIVPNASLLLETIRSRTHTIKAPSVDDLTLKKKVKEFINEPLVKRLEMVSEIIDKNKNNETSGELRFQATEFLNEIEKAIYEKLKKDIKDTNIQFILTEIANNRVYLSTPGASVKMILEHIALML